MTLPYPSYGDFGKNLVVGLLFVLISFASGLHLSTDKPNTNECNGFNHMPGSWVQHNVGRSSFQCCPWDMGQPMPETFQCSKPNRPRAHNLSYYDGLFGRQLGGWGCMCQSRYGGENAPHERFIWEPTHCKLPAWDSERFCEALGNRRILFIGDSTMEQTASTLMALIRGRQHPVSDTINACLSRIGLGSSDSLIGAVRDRGRPWTEFVKEHSPDIVIVNAGAHFFRINAIEKRAGPNNTGPINTTIEKVVGTVLREWADIQPTLKRSMNRDPVLMWKTQQPGHADCASAEGPPARLATDYGEIETMGPFNWDNFTHYDEVAEALFTSAGHPILDLRFLSTRNDSHSSHKGDCLHLCTPGPLDTVGAVLLNQLEHGLGN